LKTINYSAKNEKSENLLPNQLKDHNYAEKKQLYFDIDQQYADDLGWANNPKEKK